MVLIAGGQSSVAVLFQSTGDPSYQTNAPGGALEGSGWQFQGRFNSYLGTPVGPHHFIAASHVGGNVGNKFYYNGGVYTTTARTIDSGSDLTLWRVAERFSSYAPLYSAANESGKGLVVFGRGVDRGAAVTNTITKLVRGKSVTTAMTNGWLWGTYNYTQRWGTNVVSGTVVNPDGYPLLAADWNAGGDDCMLADKDSSGGVFIKDGAVWKLAGINYAVGPRHEYSFSPDGSNAFKAAILDFSGDNDLYVQNGSNWVTTASLGITKSTFYASRISSRYSWITNNVADFDADTDLLPDWWEASYTNSTTAMLPGDDLDGDGFSNLEEYIADTHPTNPASFFEMNAFSASAGQTVYFNGSTGRVYRLVYTTNDLSAGTPSWTAAQTNWVPGTGSGSSITVTNSFPAAFYRLQVALP